MDDEIFDLCNVKEKFFDMIEDNLVEYNLDFYHEIIDRYQDFCGDLDGEAEYTFKEWYETFYLGERW